VTVFQRFYPETIIHSPPLQRPLAYQFMQANIFFFASVFLNGISFLAYLLHFEKK
jgi:hypothetical protein